MRTIKFRGYNRKNGQWLTGFYLQNRGAHFVCPDEFADGKSLDDYEVASGTVGQFTGLHDKNGREIYEGDIITHGSKTITYTVVWNDTGLRAKQNNSSSYAGLTYWQGCTEVLGNIHDNPELIKQED